MSDSSYRLDPLRERLLGPELTWARALLADAGLGALVAAASACLAAVQLEGARFDRLARDLEGATRGEQAKLIERYLRETVGDAAPLARDLRALARGEPGVLDVTALGERFARQSDAAECRAEACLALARMSPQALQPKMVEAVLELARVPGRWSRRIEAIGCLARLKASTTDGSVRAAVQEQLVMLTARTEQRWVQCAALDALAVFDGPGAHAIARERLLRPGPGDDLLVRAIVVTLIGLRKRARWIDVLHLAHDDPSEHVRITAARVQSSELQLCRIARSDPSHRVRASALIRLARKHPQASPAPLCEAIARETHGFVIQTAAEELAHLGRRGHIGIETSVMRILADAAVRGDVAPSARGACRDALAALQTLRDVSAAVLAELEFAVLATPVGKTTEVTSARLLELSDAALGRALAVVARDDFGAGIDRRSGKLLVHRGERGGFSLWRTIFELLHPAPDKRQGFSHINARRLKGALRAPPGGLAEATATRVPGERVLAESRGDWGRELPRVEDLLAQRLVRASPTRIASAVGIATVSSATSFAQRLVGSFRLALHYSRYAELRQRALESDDPDVRSSYAREVLRATGTTLEIVPYAFDCTASRSANSAAPGGSRALALAPMLPLGSLHAFWDNLRQLSVPTNEIGLPHLAACSVVLLGALLGRQAFIRRQIAVERGAIPLVIGGWGTRGKSGSERLKAALFQGLGYECLVKTTGCEAMFIRAVPGLPAREVFIYRPYDKPTVWEQRSVLSLAARLNVRVFLWECMALQPELVNLLQLQWMRDDLSTITNAYPDHEDLQGPTGLDVANTIAEFVPEQATAFTSEVQMLPLIKARAAARGTRVVSVPPREAELIADDLRSRFGHDEHPANIALVASLARRSGVPNTVAIAEMADHVVADLGALRTFRTVHWRGRRLTFTNGMGANDRAATLENWRRAGFDTHGAQDSSGWVVTVVNNRADRPARTVVFADLLVKDISADRHVLIGTNLSGMLRELARALTEHVYAHLPTRDLPAAPALQESVLCERLATAFARLHVEGIDVAGVVREASRKNVPLPPLELIERLLVPSPGESYPSSKLRVEQGLIASKQELSPLLISIIARRRIVRALQSMTLNSPDRATALEVQFGAAYRAIFLENVVCLADPAMSGDSIIDWLATRLPAGASARIMGLQNIKGVGLDFVYRWVSIDTVQRICVRFASADPSAHQEAARSLMVHDDYGVVDATLACEAVDRARASGGGGQSYDAAYQRLAAIVTDREARLGATSETGWLERLQKLAGETLDFADAIRRRALAARVLEALATGQISQATAALRMRRVLERSKGGWLTKRAKNQRVR